MYIYIYIYMYIICIIGARDRPPDHLGRAQQSEATVPPLPRPGAGGPGRADRRRPGQHARLPQARGPGGGPVAPLEREADFPGFPLAAERGHRRPPRAVRHLHPGPEHQGRGLRLPECSSLLRPRGLRPRARQAPPQDDELREVLPRRHSPRDRQGDLSINQSIN